MSVSAVFRSLNMGFARNIKLLGQNAKHSKKLLQLSAPGRLRNSSPPLLASPRPFSVPTHGSLGGTRNDALALACTSTSPLGAPASCGWSSLVGLLLCRQRRNLLLQFCKLLLQRCHLLLKCQLF